MNLASEHVCKAEHVIQAQNISLKHVPGPKLHLVLSITLWPWNMYEINFTQFLLDI